MAKEAAATKEEKVSNQELQQVNSGELMVGDIDWSEDVGAGMESATADSFAIPFLGILQKGSPQVDEQDGKYIEGAKPGMLINTVTGDLFDGKEGVLFIPCHYQQRFLRWAPRGEGGGAGFKGEIMPEEVARMRANKEVIDFEGRLYFPLADGSVHEKKCDILGDHRNHFGLVIGKDGMPQQVLMSLASTQIKHSKVLMSLLQQKKVETPNGMVTPPTFLNMVRITTRPEQNEKGSWYGYNFKLEGTVTNKAMYQAGRDMHKAVANDDVNVNYSAARADEEATEDGKF